MQRSRSVRAQDGSASLLFAVVVLPLMLVFLSVGIEVSQFFGVREEVVEHLDFELMSALRSGESESEVADRVRARLHRLRPYVEVDQVQVTRNGGGVDGSMRGRYRGPLIEVAAHLIGASVDGAPLEVQCRARRPRSAAVIVLDRTLPEGADLCGNAGLVARAEAISRLSSRLQSAGVERIELAVFPGEGQEIEMVGVDDRIPRCSSEGASQKDIRGVQGVAQGNVPDVLSSALRIAESLVAVSGAATFEQRSLIIVAPHRETSEELMLTSFSLLENEAIRQQIDLQSIGVAVDESEHGNFFTTKSSSGRSAYLRVSREDLSGASFETALLHHTQGRLVIAR